MLVRTQHLPPPAETARGLGIPGLAGLLANVPLCLMMCRCEPLHSSGYGHMADGIRPEPAVHQTAGSSVRAGIQGSLAGSASLQGISMVALVLPPRTATLVCDGTPPVGWARARCVCGRAPGH